MEALQLLPLVFQDMRRCAMEVRIILLVLKAFEESVGSPDRKQRRGPDLAGG